MRLGRTVRRRVAALSAGLLVIAYCILRYGDCVLTFFFLDDFWLMRDAAQMQLRTVGDIARFFSFTHMGFHLYRPLTQAVYFYALHRAFGIDPSGYHLVQIATFCANALLVLAIAWRASASLLCGLCAALLYAAAPGHAVAVFWIAAFTMSGTALAVFTMIAWWQRSRGRWRLVGCTVLQIIALLCSEHAIVAPLLLVTVSTFSARREGWRDVLRDVAGPGAVAAAYGIAKVTYLAVMGWPPGPYHMRFEPEIWLPRIGRYAAATLNLLTNSITTVQARLTLGGVVCGVAVLGTICVLRGWTRWRLLALGTDVFLIGLLPVLPLGKQHEYDFFIGIAGLGAAIAYVGLFALVGGAQSAAVVAAVATVAVLGVDARSGDRAARGNQIFLLYQRMTRDNEALMTNLSRVVEIRPPGPEILVPRNEQTAGVLEFGQAGDVFFRPPLRVRLVPPARTPVGPGQVFLPQPALPLGERRLPFWWRPELDWIRLWLPPPRFWYRDHFTATGGAVSRGG